MGRACCKFGMIRRREKLKPRFHLRSLALLVTVVAVALGVLSARGYFAKGVWTVERVLSGVVGDSSFTSHYYAECTRNEGSEKITIHFACAVNDFLSPEELTLREGDVFQIISDDLAETKKGIELLDGTFIKIVRRTNRNPTVGQRVLEF